MGSYCHLRIGRLNIDWNKNYLTDHSILFSSSDLSDVEYHYADNVVEMHPGYTRKLCKLESRLFLLGFNKLMTRKLLSEHFSCPDFSVEHFTPEIFLSILKKIDIPVSVYDEEHEFFQCSELSQKVKTKIETDSSLIFLKDNFYSISELLDSLNPYLFLAICIYNDIFINEDVVWEYSDLVRGGYVQESEVFHDISENPPYLIITEGSSDSEIIKRSIEWIYPDLAGFFEFIDMKDNYPFTGVGNIVNFYHGICKIKTNRKIIFLFDNDTAGNAGLINCISPPENISLVALPEHESFESYLTIGPSGEQIENINGKAVSIELFLDQNFKGTKPSRIRWTAFNYKMNQYQGEIENKTKLEKQFIKASNKRDDSYDLTMLKKLLEYLFNTVNQMVTITKDMY